MSNGDRDRGVPVEPQNPIAPLRGYLLYIAERYLGSELRTKGSASDLVQTALLAAQQAREQFRGRTPEEHRGWLRCILLNVLRKFRRRWRSDSRDSNREVHLNRQAADRLHQARHESPSHTARQQEQRQLLAEAVSRLPDEQQRVIALHLDGGLSFVEIGRLLGKSSDAVRMVYNRALERLQTLLPGTLA